MESLKAQGRPGCSPSSPARTPLLGEVRGLPPLISAWLSGAVQPSCQTPNPPSSAFWWRPRPDGMHKSKIAGTVVPGTIKKSLSSFSESLLGFGNSPRWLFFFFFSTTLLGSDWRADQTGCFGGRRPNWIHGHVGALWLSTYSSLCRLPRSYGGVDMLLWINLLFVLQALHRSHRTYWAVRHKKHTELTSEPRFKRT